MFFYRVILPLPLKEPLIYASSRPLSPGSRVVVPLKRRRLVGVILESIPEGTELPAEVREIEDLLDPEPLLSPELLHFLRWCWEYYLCPPGEMVRQAFPPGFFRELKRRVRLSAAGRRALREGRLPEGWSVLTRPRLIRRVLAEGIIPSAGEIERLVKEGLLEEVEDQRGLQPPMEEWLEFVGEEPLSEGEEILRRRKRWPRRLLEEEFGREEVRAWISSGRVRRLRLPRLRKGPVLGDLSLPEPDSEQKRVIGEIRQALGQGFRTFLLHGVTGSGKTLVYLKVAEEALAQGKDVLVLVPEIALTPYVEAHLVARFGSQVAVLHSALSAGWRAAEWFRIARGEARVVVGARSAVFAPLRRPGLIVVDEEHEGTYKQNEGLRYQARDLALMRGKLCGATVILGSATPSVKSYFLAREGRYTLLRLRRRPAGRRPPRIELVVLQRPGEYLTPELTAAMEETLKRGEQVLLFLNRRGYAPVVFCRECGEALECPNCSLTLTYHRGSGILLCHHCGFSQPAFPVCPRCEGTRFRTVGIGTERLEEELRQRFPGVGVARLDRDSVTSEKRLYDLLLRLRRGEIQIVVGTQMVAQGHDLPGVSLVGVIWAEGGLHLPDFRAAERTFQLLVQVAGRAGRGTSPGRVILQTRLPHHYAVACALREDYEGFYREELERRKQLGFPPFSRLALLVFSGIRPEKTEEAARESASFLASLGRAEVLGPAPAPLPRLAGRYRWQVLLRSLRSSALDQVLRAFLREKSRLVPSGISVTLDRDPEELL